LSFDEKLAMLKAEIEKNAYKDSVDEEEEQEIQETLDSNRGFTSSKWEEIIKSILNLVLPLILSLFQKNK